MARFSLTGCHVFPGGVTKKAGTNIADSVANALAGDYVVSGLNSSTVTPSMVPLDGAATTMKAASLAANTPAPAISGRASID
jgi:hypothetical protein